MNQRDRIRHCIARRAAGELKDGDVVNLGIGIPTLVSDYIPPGVAIHLHTENGMLEVGPTPPPDQVDPQLVNASRQPITELPGASYFDSGLSFAMMRGGHLDTTIIGALQVSQTGDIASWAVPGKQSSGSGGHGSRCGGQTGDRRNDPSKQRRTAQNPSGMHISLDRTWRSGRVGDGTRGVSLY